MKLTDDQIEYLLSVLNQDGIENKPTQRTKRVFKAELEVWKAAFEFERDKQKRKIDVALTSKTSISSDWKPVSKMNNIEIRRKPTMPYYPISAISTIPSSMDARNTVYMQNVSEDYINQKINNEISYVRDIVISNFVNIQENFRKKLEQFITKKKQEQQQLETYAVIYCIYPGQTELKISFFGQNVLVKRANRQLKYLIDQNRLITWTTEFTLTQRNYLLDNCLHQLETIEYEYKDDNVKIKIRENQLYAPHYLKIKIQQRINNLIDQQYPLIFQYIGNDSILTNDEKLQLEEIAGQFKCQIDKIDLQTKKEIVTLPKVINTSTLKSSPKFIIKKSKEFYSSLSLLKTTSIANSTIELHLANDVTAPQADITIISMITSDIEDDSKLNGNNLQNKTDTDKSVKLFYSLPHWSKVNNDQNDTDFKNSIKTFISNSLKDISVLSLNKENIITFSTDEWDNYSSRKQLAEEIINEIKVQLETSKLFNVNWRILFIFNDNQTDLYNRFLQTILSITMNTNNYEQFFYPVSSM
ncbi:unnamed protein product [Rotaria sp. Silwood2]|nr:unnamed protein product [Rotaria sp. Silwood2]